MSREILTVQSTLPGAVADKNLLAIDTSLGSVVAISRGDAVWEIRSQDPLGHTEVIGTMIQTALQAAQMQPDALDGVVMGVGPGSFTGLRVGMAAATAFAVGANLPLLPVVSHEASAIEAALAGATGELAVVQDARRKELFITEYQLDAVVPGQTLPQVVSASRVEKRAEHVETVAEKWPDHVSGVGLLLAAATRLANGQAFVGPEPLYLRDPDVRPPAGVKPVVPR